MKDSSAVCVLRGYHEWGPSAIHTLFGRLVDRCHWCGVERPALTDRERLVNLAEAVEREGER